MLGGGAALTAARGGAAGYSHSPTPRGRVSELRSRLTICANC